MVVVGKGEDGHHARHEVQYNELQAVGDEEAHYEYGDQVHELRQPRVEEGVYEYGHYDEGHREKAQLAVPLQQYAQSTECGNEHQHEEQAAVALYEPRPFAQQEKEQRGEQGQQHQRIAQHREPDAAFAEVLLLVLSAHRLDGLVHLGGHHLAVRDDALARLHHALGERHLGQQIRLVPLRQVSIVQQVG